MKKRIFIRKKYGRLGNNLYRWAHLIAFARENGAEVWDLSRTTSQYFRFFPKLNRKLLPIVAERKCFSMGCGFLQYQIGKVILKFVRMFNVHRVDNRQGMFNLSDQAIFGGSETVLLSGFRFEAIDSLAKHADYVRDLFAPPKHVRVAAEEFVHRRTAGEDLIIAVHIRRGDYANFMGGEYYFDMDVYARVLKSFASDHSDQKCKFLIFSDDSNLVLDDFAGLDVELSDFTYGRYFDWFLMSKCHYIIAPPSTYSGWASFYGSVPVGRIICDCSSHLKFRVNSHLDDESSVDV